MVLSILLALTVIIVMIDVIVGIHRGVKFGLVRLGIWILGIIVCLLITQSVTEWLLLKLAKVPGMKLFSFDVFGGWLGSHTDTIGNHLSALSVSIMAPVVFVALFLITKFITWIIYLIVKHFIKKSAKWTTAHNAAVDAVTAVKSSEMPEADQQVLEQPFVPSLSKETMVDENGEEFGTFGIYPKEAEEDSELSNESEKTLALSADPTDAFSMLVAGEESSGADADEEVEEEQEAPGEDADDEEAVETSEEASEEEEVEEPSDGFESLAMAAAIEDEKKEAERAKEKAKQAKEKKTKIKPAKERKLKKRWSVAVYLLQDSKLSRVLGGVLGMFIGLVASAIIISPITEIVKIIRDSDMAKPMVELTIYGTNLDFRRVVNEAFVKGDEPITVLPTYFNVIGDLGFRTDDFVDVFSTMDDSAVHYIYKFSGADFVSSHIYAALTEVKPQDIGLDYKGIKSYDIAETLKCYVKLAPDANRVIEMINNRTGLSVELVDGLEKGLLHLLDISGEGAILTDYDKLKLMNGMAERFNEVILEQIEADPEAYVFRPFESYQEAREGIKAVFDAVKQLIKIGVLK